MRLFAAAASAALLSTSPALADITLYDNNNAELVFSGRVEALGFATRNTNFGAGAFADNDTEVSWFEAITHLDLDGKYTFSPRGAFVYGGASVVGSLTRGDGDPTGFTLGEPEDIDNDEAFAGINSGQMFGDITVDFSAGAQSFHVGDSFIIGDGHFDNGEDGALYLSPRDAFRETAILKIDAPKGRSDIFYIKGDEEQGDAAFSGVNLEYAPTQTDRFGLLAMLGIDSDAAFNPIFPGSRDGLRVLSLRYQGNPAPELPDLFLSSEFAFQWNERGNRDIEANAYYGEAAYTFSKAKWTPQLMYRYFYFSGDDPTTPKSEEYDSLFFGYSRGWTTWFLSQIVGEYLIPNSNTRGHILSLRVQPHEKLALGTIGHRFYRVQPTCTTCRDGVYADEYNAYAEVEVNKWLRFTTLYAAAVPGDAASSEFGGNDEVYHLFGGYATLSF